MTTVIASDLGTVAWGGGVSISASELAAAGVEEGDNLEIAFTTSGGQFYVTDMSDWNSSAVWYNSGSSIIVPVTSAMIANGIMMNGADATIDKVTVYNVPASSTIEPNVTYKQISDDNSAVRFVQLISQELADNSSEVTFTISNGSSTVTRTSTSCYDSISVAGSELTAPEGYVFIAYAITGIPFEAAATALTCTISIE